VRERIRVGTTRTTASRRIRPHRAPYAAAVGIARRRGRARLVRRTRARDRASVRRASVAAGSPPACLQRRPSPATAEPAQP